MDFGVVLQNTAPASRVVELARQAELHGFTHAWTFDSHLLWEEPYVVYSAMLAATRNIVVGPMVTNPLTRDWTVTASSYATLNEMYGPRTICGIGRGDSAVRTLAGRPSTLATLREAVHVIRELANGRSVEHRGQTIRFPWARATHEQDRTQVWVAAYGPKALQLTGEVADGFILQLADPDIAAWTIRFVREAAERAGRDPGSVKICVAAPAYVTDGSQAALEHARDQCRWFGGMVGNHVADIVERYGATGEVPAALTGYIAGRRGYDYNEHGRAGNTHADFVPDEIVDRFCVIGTAEQHRERMRALQDLGVDQFALYLQHDAKETTMRAYADHVAPGLAPQVAAVRPAVPTAAPAAPPITPPAETIPVAVPVPARAGTAGVPA
ncbi:TIGR03842 family LLM class F420-dependent oxidoreductase [Kineococcus radiotolerans]|uniref:Luciferase family protein n=1 Tax=Kineococcus radiotolerans (strain ATCC BAA-149 / DSM 14245 / SRS30216) TaxID=266940 RepID=A6WFZ2_KINRD|nr:TIGR03842 family LLM class F420-dependent oxidoreductase [Kineococcus radiotolerans]ABS05731.1 luciferase family protein [Kineococcus radiotolerans SRS30216 = ATCC BAA-149]